MSDDIIVSIDLQAAENATSEDARIRLKVIKHYVRALLGDEEINMKVKILLKEIGIEAESPWSVVAGYPLALAVLKQQHKCKGSVCVQNLKKKTARNAEKFKKKKELEKKRNEKKAARQTKQRENSAMNMPPSGSFVKPPDYYI